VFAALAQLAAGIMTAGNIMAMPNNRLILQMLLGAQVPGPWCFQPTVWLSSVVEFDGKEKLGKRASGAGLRFGSSSILFNLKSAVPLAAA